MVLRALDQRMECTRPVWLIAQFCGAATLVAAIRELLPLSVVLAWSAALTGLIVLPLIGRSRERGRGPTASRWSDTVGGALFGLAWAVALVLAGSASEHGALTSLMAGVARLLVVAALFLTAAAPLGGIAFILVSGIGSITVAIAAGDVARATMALLFALLGSGALVANARYLVQRIGAEIALARREATVGLLLREFEDKNADWLWATDGAKRLTDVSPRLAELLGESPAAIEGRPLLAMLAGRSWEDGCVAAEIRALSERLTRRESFRDLVVPLTIAGEARWWSLSGTPHRDDRGEWIGFRGVGTDVTERHRRSERIDQMAHYDALTGLANRAHIIEALGETLRESHASGRRSALMLLDLDRFKQVNDTLGHPVGDKLLVAVAGRLRTLAGAGDLCGRLGGDEFAVVIADASDRDRVETLAETIVSSLSAPYEIDGHRLHIGASVGSATAPRDGRIVETLLRSADLALYSAKDGGRGVHRRYEPRLHAAAEERRAIETALRDAIERGEFRLVYQPIVSSAGGQLTAFEALLRWDHPDIGAVPPETFIPIAEEARLIGRIGDWVMHTACRAAATWPDQVRVSVNMAAAQLRDPQLAATIVAALSHSGLAADRLELEIAEEVLVSDDGGIAIAIDRLLGIGVRVLLDDFGTGRSAFGFLRKGRFSSVKIDRAFVRGASANAPESVAVVRAIVALADSLGMTTIAEGAETRGEFERMQRLGCALVQGWQVGQPLDADAAHALATTSASGDTARRVA